MRWCLIVATLHRVAPLEALLTSLSDAPPPDLRVVVVDQNDDDRLCLLIAGFAGRLRIDHIRVAPQGLSAARNVGLQQLGDADLVAFPDDDCAYAADTLEQATLAFGRLPHADVLLGAWRDRCPAGVDDATPGRPRSIGRLGLLRQGATWIQFYRRRVVDRVGPFDPSLGPGGGSPWLCGEDSDYLIRAWSGGASVWRVPAVRVYHPAIDVNDPGLARKAFGYGRGRMRILRKHSYPSWFKVLSVLHPLANMLLKPHTAGFYWHTFRGRLREAIRPHRARCHDRVQPAPTAGGSPSP